MDESAEERLERSLRELIAAAERVRAPELEALLAMLGRRLIKANRLDEAADLVNGATAKGMWLSSTARTLAQAQVRSGDVVRAEGTIREAVKREPADAEAQRLLYRLLKDSGRTAEAHAALDRLVALDPTAATATFAHRERAKLGATQGREVRIALLSSYVLDPLIPFLDAECRRAQLALESYISPYNQYTQDVFSATSGLYAFGPEVVFLALDLEDVFPAARGVPTAEELARGRDEILSAIVGLVRELRSRSDALIVVHELVPSARSPHGILDNRRGDGMGQWTADLNWALAQALTVETHAFLLPLREVLARVGVERGQSRKLHYMARMRHADATLRELARTLMRYVKPLKGLTRKCVVVDLDGTLWGGVVGEVGPEGIQLGPAAPGIEYVDFQEALLNLTKRGILLAICSKNNPDDVLPVLRDHKHMVLHEEHFSAMRINWRNKAENLAELAAELNIGLDALVFLDDNPVERELVRQLLPEVLVVDMPKDASLYRTTLEDLTDFELLAITREDELRVSQYQANRKRQALEQSARSLDEYLHSLDIRAAIGRAQASHVPRLVQMFNKTNQFNTTTRRYQPPDVERFLSYGEHQVYVLDVVDRFGEHGLVGTAVVREQGDTWFIDNVLLSCRVMGLSVETAVLKHIYDEACRRGVVRLVGEFIPTKKNGPCSDFFQRHGFRPDGDVGDVHRWILDPRAERIEKPSWIAVSLEGASA